MSVASQDASVLESLVLVLCGAERVNLTSCGGVVVTAAPA
jgi:hypothetical protein